MSQNYHKSYKEVLEILKYMPKEELDKIPINLLKMFEEKMDKDYKFEFDETQKLEEQKLMTETKAILANLFRDYWATDEQKAKIIAKQNYDRKTIEENKKEKYNPDNIFKDTRSIENTSTKETNNNEIINNNKSLIEYKEPFFVKLKKFILKILHIE